MLRKNDDIQINITPGPRHSPHRIGSGSGTGPLDYESRDPVPDLETQSLEVRYRIPSQSYEDCLGVREYIISYYTAVIFAIFFIEV